MSRKYYGILCESDSGFDVFGNAEGKMILMESVGEQLHQHEALDRAENLKRSGRYGDVKLVELKVVEGFIL